jgi:hypothetical protein
MQECQSNVQALKGVLDECGHRQWVACETLELVHGGLCAVAQAIGLGGLIRHMRGDAPMISSIGLDRRWDVGFRKVPSFEE